MSSGERQAASRPALELASEPEGRRGCRRTGERQDEREQPEAREFPVRQVSFARPPSEQTGGCSDSEQHNCANTNHSDDNRDGHEQPPDGRRLSCSARRRATLSGLIEHFERLAERTAMRNIITPVKWTPSDSSSDQVTGETDDASQSQLSDHGDGAELAACASGRAALARRLTRPNWAPPTDGRQYERRHSRHHQRQLPQAHSAAHRAPKLVRHQASSSRRHLRQLASLRRLSEPNYRVRRPEKVEQVERLIEQLERASAHWQDDDELLERADGRDWPADYHRRFGRSAPSEEPGEAQEEGGEFRLEVERLEERVIALAHARQARATSQLGARRPLAPSDADDLAVRRLTAAVQRGPSPAGGWSGSLGSTSSYLLCAGAPTRGRSRAPLVLSPDWPDSQERAQDDDLHWRRLAGGRPLEAHEPPFGIPRRPTPHSSASHYLRRLADSRAATPTRRPDSRVSFAGRVSADSGVANAMDEDGLSECELDIDLELAARPPDDCPTLERHRTQLSATPTRLRPQIAIENPRSKSPLLRVGRSSGQRQLGGRPAEGAQRAGAVTVRCYADQTSELECSYQFTDSEASSSTGERRTRRPNIRTDGRVSQTRTAGEVHDHHNHGYNNIDGDRQSDSSGERRRLDYRAHTRPLRPSEAPKVEQGQTSGTKFSIGQWKSLDRSKLKIL